MSTETTAGFSPVEEVWADLQQIAGFTDVPYEVDLSSSSGATVLLTAGDNPMAIKFKDISSRHNGNLLLREALLLAMLNDAKPPSPLMIPKPIDGQLDRPPYYLVMERVPGRVLDCPEIRALSVEEKRLLGSAVGAFAAWMSTAVDAYQYETILYNTTTEMFDRVQSFNRYYGWLATVKQMGCMTLGSDSNHFNPRTTILND